MKKKQQENTKKKTSMHNRVVLRTVAPPQHFFNEIAGFETSPGAAVSPENTAVPLATPMSSLDKVFCKKS